MKKLLIGLTSLALCVTALLAAPAKEEAEEAIRILKTSKDPKARAAAAKELARLAEIKITLVKPAYALLLDSLKDGDGAVRLEAVGAFSYLGPFDKETVPNLIGLLKEGENRNTRLTAVLILAQVQGDARPAITPLQDIQTKENAKGDQRDGQLADSAGQTIVAIRANLVGSLMTTLKDDKDAKARVAAATDLASTAQAKVELVKPAIPVLVDALKDEDVAVRRAAITALVLAKPGPEVVTDVLRSLQPREDRAVRLGAVSLLGGLGANARDAVGYLEAMQTRETKKSDAEKDKEMLEKVEAALKAIKGQ